MEPDSGDFASLDQTVRYFGVTINGQASHTICSAMADKPDPQAIKARQTAIFDQVASGYDNHAQRFFPLSAAHMITLARPMPGERVLDVATGTGLAAIASAQAIGPGGRVQAIDLSAGMLDQARHNIHKHALDNVDLQLMDAEQLDFGDNDFDLISCAFGVFFFTDYQTALRNWLRVLRPGGRLVFTTFGASSFMPLARLFRESVEATGIDVPTPVWQQLCEPQHCRQLVEQAGYTQCEVSTEQMGYHLASEHEWWELLCNSGFRGILNRLSATQLAQLRDQHLQQVAALRSEDGIWLDVEVHFTRAQKPAAI